MAGDNPREEADRVTKLLKTVRRDHVPRIRPKPKVNPLWSPGLTLLKGSVKITRKAYQDCCLCRMKFVKQGKWRSLRNLYTKAIKGERLKSWQNFMRECSEDPYGFLYKMAANKLRVKEILSTITYK